MGSKWSEFNFIRKGRIQFFCPLCHSQQATKVAEKITWIHHLQLSLITAVITVAAWDYFGINSLVFYLIFWSILEFSHRMKKRHQLVCKVCGFDPFLYKQDSKRARDAVKKFWEEKIEKENAFQGVKLKNYSTKMPQTEKNIPPSENKEGKAKSGPSPA